MNTFSKIFLLFAVVILIPSFSNAATRYADGQMSANCTSGNYSIANRNCSGSDGNAYGGMHAIDNAIAASAATDTVLVRQFGGTYIGTASDNCIQLRGGLSPSSRFTVRGYQSELPVSRCFEFYTANYVHLYQIRVTGSVAEGLQLQDTNNNRIGEYGFITEVDNHGLGAASGGINSEFINVNVHHNGFGCWAPGFCHGMYIDEGILINGGEYHHNESFGIHCYDQCVNATIRNVRAYSNGATGIGVFGFANANVSVYNNIAYDNGGYGISASAGGNYYNNTVINNAAGSMFHGMLPATSRNNILLGGGTYTPVAEHWGTSQNLGNATQSDNITSGSASDYFIDTSNGDFRLKSSAS